MTKRSTLGGGALIGLALLFIGQTVLFSHLLRGWRIDLTENGLYTLAPGTKRILDSLEEPINLYFFFSEETAAQFPTIRTYGTRVRELLEELVDRSNGKLRLSVIDPQPFSEEEDRAAEFGIGSAPAGPGGAQLYFGLAGTNSTDGRATIEFFDPSKEQFLEYDIVKLIYQLANPKRPVVGWLSGLRMGPDFDPITRQFQQPWMIYSQAQQLFTLRMLDTGLTSIDPEIDLLVVVHPKNLPQAAQFAIDQYALRGGHIAVFVDPIAEMDSSGSDPSNPMMSMTADKSSDLPLLSHWGVQYNPREVIADLESALTVSMRQGDAPVRHLGILGFGKNAFNDSDVITAGLSSVNVATAGYLKPAEGAGTTFEPLLQTSTQAAPLPAERFVMLFDPATLRDGFRPTGERYAVAARVTGKVKTAFPDGPPEGVTLPEGQEPLTESTEPLNLVVFADTDMLADYLWVRQQSFFGQRIAQAWAGNGDLVFNTLDNLAGSTDLISVRGRAAFTRPFDRVEALRRAAEDRFRAKEQELEAELRATEEKLTALESSRNDDNASLLLTPEQQQELARFQQEKLRIRKELRDVRLGLNQDIERLGTILKFTNIVAAPGAFAAIALLVAAIRRRRPAPRVVPQEGAAS